MLRGERVVLRPPVPHDAATLHAYAQQEGGLLGIWVPLQPGATRDACDALVADWLAGWQGLPSKQGPTFVVTDATGDRLIGVVTFAPPADVIEIAYGTAPGQRGRGVATEAARLATEWLLRAGHATEVELLIGTRHVESQRVAAKAGFRRVGTRRGRVPATGEEYEDFRYVRTRADSSW